MREVKREFYSKMVEEWSRRMQDASANGDHDAWKVAEKEVRTYETLLKNSESL